MSQGRLQVDSQKNVQLYYRKDCITAFFRVITEILAEGDTVRCFGYFKIEPKLYKARKVQNPHDNILYDAPAQYKPKIKFGKQIKEACANIPVEKMENSNEDKNNDFGG